MLVGLFLNAVLATSAFAPPGPPGAPVTANAVQAQVEATALDRVASGAGCAVAAGSGALAGFAVASVSHITLQVLLPAELTLSVASLGAPFGAAAAIVLLGAPFLDGPLGVTVVASMVALVTGGAQLAVGIPFVLSDGAPFGSYELGIISMIVVPPLAAALSAGAIAPFFAAAAE